MRIVANAICECLIHSAKDCIPVHQHKRVAGWNDSASFLKQFKYHGHTAPVIDGVSGDPQIAGLWSTKFKELYNRCNPSTRNSLQKQLNYIITEDDLEVLIVDTYTIICAIKRLKAGKSDRKILDVCSCSVCATNFSFQTVLFIYCPVAGGMDIHPNAIIQP